MACNLLSISETCYRYVAKLEHKNTLIADWLLRLTHMQRNWGFVNALSIFGISNNYIASDVSNKCQCKKTCSKYITSLRIRLLKKMGV